VRPSARRDATAREQGEVTAYLTEAQYAWASELAQAMSGLNCTMSDVVRLALDELRSRHPSPKRLEAALREYVWREREGNAVSPELPGVRLHALPAPRRRAGQAQQAAPAVQAEEAAGQAGPIRVLVVADHPTFRAGLRSVLAGRTDVEVVGEGGDLEAALALVRRRRPHVVLLDLSASGGVAAIGAITATRPAANVVVLSTFADRERVVAAVKAGAAGYLPRDASPDELVQGIRAAGRGELPGALRTALALVGDPSDRAPGAALLTRREREILALVGRGLANKQIALRLGISEKTVKAHLGRAFQRIGVADRTQAALWAERNGLLARA